MKRWIHASESVNASSDIDKIKSELQQMFNTDPELVLGFDTDSSYTGEHSYNDAYTINYNDAHEIELDRQRYYRFADGYMGRDSVATGFYQVAKAVSKIEPDLSNWIRIN